LMSTVESIEYGKFYHIYNRGINSCNLFRENSNYEYFLRLYDKHVSKVVDTFAWVLMKNHFHFLIRVKDEEVFLMLTKSDKHSDSKNPHQHFSNLFNAYTKAYNIRYKRHGSLFERSFKRKLVEDENYLSTLITYIHNNPVHHGIKKNMVEYPWSSLLNYNLGQTADMHLLLAIDCFQKDIKLNTSDLSKKEVLEIDEWLGLTNKPVRSKT